MLKRLEGLQAQSEQLRKALSIAEEKHSQLDSESKDSAQKYRDMADKVYELMEQLRMNTVELKKAQGEASQKAKAIVSYFI